MVDLGSICVGGTTRASCSRGSYYKRGTDVVGLTVVEMLQVVDVVRVVVAVHVALPVAYGIKTTH